MKSDEQRLLEYLKEVVKHQKVVVMIVYERL